MTDFNYDRVQLAALGASLEKSRSLSTTFNVERNENGSKIGSQQEFQRRSVQLELPLSLPNQREFDFMKGPK